MFKTHLDKAVGSLCDLIVEDKSLSRAHVDVLHDAAFLLCEAQRVKELEAAKRIAVKRQKILRGFKKLLSFL